MKPKVNTTYLFNILFLTALFYMSLIVNLLAQDKQPFTIEDALNVKTSSIQSVSDDGKYTVLAIGTHRGRLNVDHFRFGDPTYISPRLSEYVVIDTSTLR